MTNKIAALREPSTALLNNPAALQPTQQDWQTSEGGVETRSDLEVRIFSSIESITPGEWDSLCGEHAVTRSHDYLRAVEAARIEGITHYYLRVYDASGNAIAQAPAYVVVTDFGQLMPRFLIPALTRIRAWWPSLLTARITECATPLFAGLALSPNEAVARPAVIAALERAMNTIAKSENSRLLVFRDFFAHERDTLDLLKGVGYKCVNNLPLARIRVQWGTYQDYLDSMRSRYRKDLRRRFRKAERLGQTVKVVENFAGDAEQWSRQAEVIYCQAAGFKREAVNAEYYRQMNTCLGDNSKLLVVECEGKAMAHGMVIFDGENAVATFFGREAGPANGEWFLLMNEVVRMGIERRCRFINLGLGSYDAKSLVGAEEEPLYVFTRCTQPLLNGLIRLIADVMKRPPPTRNRPFRSG